ncbi:MAG TPA: hypothetical protein VK826_04085 [Bacteroidia bacterium]|nr:hypothetical protein [Bacteroidia bacterium]
MKTKTNPIVLLLLVATAFTFTSCTEAFKRKMDTAEAALPELGAKNVIVGTSTETNNGVHRSMTTLTFSGIDSKIDLLDLEQRVTKVAWDFYTSLSREDFKDETHLQVIATLSNGESQTYTFPLPDLDKVSQYQKVTDEMVQAMIDQDTAKMRELKDDDYLPDDQLGQIYAIMAYNDSVYTGKTIKTDLAGFRLANGEDDPNLELFSANYDCGTDDTQTLYTVNVDRKTKKVVYLWTKTTPRK